MTGYNVYRYLATDPANTAAKINAAPVTGTVYTDSDPALLASTNYIYYIKAFDAAANVSNASATLTAGTTA